MAQNMSKLKKYNQRKQEQELYDPKYKQRVVPIKKRYKRTRNKKELQHELEDFISND